jgi:hypothetical protein
LRGRSRKEKSAIVDEVQPSLGQPVEGDGKNNWVNLNGVDNDLVNEEGGEECESEEGQFEMDDTLPELVVSNFSSASQGGA